MMQGFMDQHQVPITGAIDDVSARFDSVVELPFLERPVLAAVYRRSAALLATSTREGFGWPVVEAMACGTPVVASDLPVFREFAGRVPDYLQPLDGPRWLATLSDYALPNSPLRNAQLQRIASFTPPSWHAHFLALEGLLSQIRSPLPAPAAQLAIS
jgi:hypothetical protein